MRESAESRASRLPWRLFAAADGAAESRQSRANLGVFHRLDRAGAFTGGGAVLAGIFARRLAAGVLKRMLLAARQLDPATAADALADRRGGHVRVRARREDQALLIPIEDDGPGVPREIRRSLFEPGVTTKRGGWGIGLALATVNIYISPTAGTPVSPTPSPTARRWRAA